MGEVVCDLSESGKASPLQPPPSPPGLPPVALRSPLHVKTHNAARVTHLPGDHSQVGWLPPSCAPHHYSKKDSSLLTRGKLLRGRFQRVNARFIPAHAGKTGSATTACPPSRVHSSSRGENSTAATSLWRLLGSSPLTRGKLFGGDLLIICHRLIPAHAGKTEPYRTPNPADQAHPRSRGENTLGSALAHQPPGSSPLTPGKPPPRAVRGADLRLIPAHAGKTARSLGVLGRRGAHPRSRGENTLGSALAHQPPGSSPLTRGKLRRPNGAR